MVPISPGPSTIEATHRVILPWPNAGKCPRVNLDIRLLATTLETEANCTVQTASFNAKDGCRVLDVTHFKDNTVTDTEDVSTTRPILGTGVLFTSDVPDSSVTRHTSQ